MTNIAVIGSANTDMVIRTPHIPAPGETILGREFFMAGGGKGANQATGAARLGGSTLFLARVGDDLFADRSIAEFRASGIDVSAVLRTPGMPSGIALITVDEAGENSIVVASGANAALSPEDVANAAARIQTCDVILVQLEIPIETVAAAIDLGHRAGKTVILNPAPARALPDEILAKLSILTPNETEAEMLTGIRVASDADAVAAAKSLAARGPAAVIVTLGKRGALLYAEGEALFVDAPVVKAVDTTAAGDIFNGALAVAVGEGMGLPEAVRFANHASAISVTRAGAQPSAPTREEVMRLIASR